MHIAWARGARHPRPPRFATRGACTIRCTRSWGSTPLIRSPSGSRPGSRSAPGGPNYLRMQQLMEDLQLHSVCAEAHCPNIGECWEHGTATFMILGDVCTRNCAYCAVAHGRPPEVRRRGAGARRGRDRRDAGCSTRSSPRSIATISPISAPTSSPRRSARSTRSSPTARSRCSFPIFRGNEESFAPCSTPRPRSTTTTPRQCRASSSAAARRPLRARDGDLPHREAHRARHPDEDGDDPRHGRDDRRSARRSCAIFARWTSTSSRSASTSVRRRAHPARSLLHARRILAASRGGREMGFRHVESGPLVRSSYHAWEQVQAAGV